MLDQEVDWKARAIPIAKALEAALARRDEDEIRMLYNRLSWTWPGCFIVDRDKVYFGFDDNRDWAK